jgi:hypothetical protein
MAKTVANGLAGVASIYFGQLIGLAFGKIGPVIAYFNGFTC